MNIDCWLNNSLERVYKWTTSKATKSLQLDLARNDRGSFQVCMRKNTEGMVISDIEVKCPNGIEVEVRSVGHIPVPHYNTETDKSELVGDLPAYVPDPLFSDLDLQLTYNETNSYWVTVKTDKDTRPGVYPINISIRVNDEIISELSTKINVYSLVIKDRANFPVTHWLYVDALCDWYDCEPFKGKFWDIVELYIEDLVEHGTNTIFSPIFTPPTDGVKRPNQLLKIRKDSDQKYVFDWSDVQKWIDLARSAGMEYFEWSHLFSQWGVENAIRIYENYDGKYSNRLLWPPETLANSKIYRKFLSQFLPEFKEFLQEEEILDKSFFHLSDEPHGQEHLKNYQTARDILKDLAPWMEIMDALSEKDFAEKGLTDMPIASIRSSLEFKEANIPHWDYFCCGPRGNYLNRLMDTPLAKIKGSGWLFYRFESLGFLHWGYNYWYKSQTRELIDPYSVSDGGAWPNWAYGDTFVVYPGERGPVDSIRWEIFAESLKDYALLQTLNLDNSSTIFCSFNSYQDYPKSAEWYRNNRTLLLEKRSDL